MQWLGQTWRRCGMFRQIMYLPIPSPKQHQTTTPSSLPIRSRLSLSLTNRSRWVSWMYSGIMAGNSFGPHRVWTPRCCCCCQHIIKTFFPSPFNNNNNIIPFRGVCFHMFYAEWWWRCCRCDPRSILNELEAPIAFLFSITSPGPEPRLGGLELWWAEGEVDNYHRVWMKWND